jgi:hypothetical protein
VQNMVSPFSGAELGFASSCVMCNVACKRSCALRMMSNCDPPRSGY